MNPNQEGKSTGAIIGAIIIIIILVVGGILLSQKEAEYVVDNDTMVVESVEELPTVDEVNGEVMAEEEALSDSVEIEDIEADLDIVNDLDELDAALEALEAELAL